MRVLIVDDEPVIRAGIRHLLGEMSAIEVTGECASGAEAIASINSAPPDLALLDVQMPGLSGLEVLNRIRPECMPLIIFITAYDEYAVTAFELNAVDYLLKPFSEERFRQSVERARQALLSEALFKSSNDVLPTRLVVRDGARYEFVPVDSIDWIESANNYVELHCGTRIHILGETLTALENKLAREKFLRVHRCRIVNTSRITAVHSEFGGTYQLELRNGIRLSTGRHFRSAIQSLLAP